MSNYTSENLIDVKPSQIPAGTLAVKIGEDVFTAGSVTVGEEVTAGYFAKDGDDLKFYPAGSQTGEIVSEIMIADTGKEEPQYEGGSGPSMNFYKCASVDTSNSTWSGHLANISDSTGIWYFSSDSTSLTYDRLTPVVGSVYDGGCSFQVVKYKVFIPSNGLVLYAPLSTSHSETEEGTSIISTGTISHSEYHGIPCAVCSSTRLMTTFPVANGSPFTYSFWASAEEVGYIFSVGSNNGYLMMDSSRYLYYGSSYVLPTGYAPLSDFQHYLITYDGTSLSLYNNGALLTSVFANSLYSSTDFALCGLTYNSSSQYQFTGYTAAHRVYNRVLDSTEISALANEFHPTAS